MRRIGRCTISDIILLPPFTLSWILSERPSSGFAISSQQLLKSDWTLTWHTGFIGGDGGTTYFLVQFFAALITKSDERMMQMTCILNQLTLKSRETRELSDPSFSRIRS
jgi:hypothetical protein